MFDLKVINSVLDQLEEERGVPKEKVLEAIEAALASAYKKEYGKRDQIIKADFDPSSGKVEFYQVKIVVDENTARMDGEEEDENLPEEERIPKFNAERHILLEDARKIKKDAELGEEITFPLEDKGDYGRISAQTAKQVIIQKIREAEKTSILKEFGEKEREIVSGNVQRIERGNIFVDLGRATGLLPRDEQIPGERYRQGERIRAYLYKVEESPRGTFLRLSRKTPEMIRRLFEMESPEVANDTVEIKAIAREAGSRSKIAVVSHDENIDPVGSLVGQRGVRVSTVMSELGGEKIDIIEWSEDPAKFVADALSPATVLSVEIDENEEENLAKVEVMEDQLSLAIGKGGQNARLAVKLTGWKIDIHSTGGEEVVADKDKVKMESTEETVSENDEKTEEPKEVNEEKDKKEEDIDSEDKESEEKLQEETKKEE